MKKNWKYNKIGDVADIVHGKNQKDVVSAHGKYPIYGSGGTIMGYATEYLCPAGTTILGRKGTINNPQYINHKFWNVDTAFGIVAKKSIDSKYLFFFIKKQDWSKMNTGTTLPSLTQAIVKNVDIPLPPLSEQKEIVEYLDSSFAKIDKLKENAAKNLEEAKALFQSALKDALEPKEGWEYCEFSKVVDSLRTGLNPRVHFKLNTEDAQGYYVTVRELKGFTFEIDSKTDRINDAAIKRINERSNLQIGDVLFSGTGTIGRTALVEEEPTWWNIKEGVYAITPNKNRLESKFLIYLFKSDLILNKIYSKASGATIRSIPMKELNKIVLPIPPLSEQQSIVSYLDSLNEKINTLQQNYSRICNECDALKQAILRQVFE